MKLLIEHGAKVNHMAHGNNALISAAGAGRRQVYEYLLPLVSKKIRATVTEADLATGEKLRARVADPHADEFVMAAARGKLDEVKAALAAGANPNAFNSSGATALHDAAYYGHLPVIETLLAAGADVNIFGEDTGMGANNTALGLVAASGYTRDHEAIIRTLVAAGAAVDVQDPQGTTPLMRAVGLGFHGFPQSVQALLDAGANMEMKDSFGRTALKLAIERKLDDIARMLRAAGAKEP